MELNILKLFVHQPEEIWILEYEKHAYDCVRFCPHFSVFPQSTRRRLPDSKWGLTEERQTIIMPQHTNFAENSVVNLESLKGIKVCAVYNLESDCHWWSSQRSVFTMSVTYTVENLTRLRLESLTEHQRHVRTKFSFMISNISVSSGVSYSASTRRFLSYLSRPLSTEMY